MRRLRVAGLVTGLLSFGTMTFAAGDVDRCAGARDLKLVNGKIVTMDKRNTVVSEVTIQNGRIETAGNSEKHSLNPCTKVINLRGRTAIPGIIDNHNHIVLLGMRPGHDIRLETANSIADVQAMIQARVKTVPAGAFITALGDWNIRQFAEKRLPTLAELDTVAPENPVLINGGGGTVTNSRGKAFFEGKGVMVGPAVVLSRGNPAFLGALNALRAVQTFDDMKQGTLDAMAYLVSLGVTSSSDMGMFVIPGTPDMQTASLADGVESLNPWTAYDAFLALHREGQDDVAAAHIFPEPGHHAGCIADPEGAIAEFLFPDFGDDMLKISGIGEFAAAWRFQNGATPAKNYESALQLVAKHGWWLFSNTLSR